MYIGLKARIPEMREYVKARTNARRDEGQRIAKVWPRKVLRGESLARRGE